MGYRGREADSFSVTGYDVVRVILGIILLTAAGLKGYEFATEPVLGDGVLESRWLLIGVVEFELLLGLWLLAGIWPKRTWKVTIGCFSLFAGISLAKALSGDASCGCFGRVPVNPWYTFGLDAVMVVLLLRFPPSGQGFAAKRWYRSGLLRATVVASAWLAVGVPAAISMGDPRVISLTDSPEVPADGAIMILEPEDWAGGRFPLLKYIDIGDRLATGRWTVVLFHHDCPDCQEAMSRYVSKSGSSGSRESTALPFAFVEMPPYGATPLVPSSCLLGKLDDDHDWFCKTPQVIRVADGNVVESGIGL